MLAKRIAVYPPAYFFRVRTRDLLVQKYASANWSKPAFTGLPTSLTTRFINPILSSPPHLPPRRTTARIRLHPSTHAHARGLCPQTPGPRRTGSDCSAHHHVNQTNLTHAVPAVQSPRLPCAPQARPAPAPYCILSRFCMFTITSHVYSPCRTWHSFCVCVCMF